MPDALRDLTMSGDEREEPAAKPELAPEAEADAVADVEPNPVDGTPPPSESPAPEPKPAPEAPALYGVAWGCVGISGG